LQGFFFRFLSIFKHQKIDKSLKRLYKVLPEEKFSKLERIIGYSINDKIYYIQALIHRSFLEQNSEFKESNERLEFLGDSVLSLVVAGYLFEVFPKKDEGFLTKIRAKLVNGISLANVADSINLADYLLVSKNLANNFSSGPKTVLSDAFEALVGAIYLDNGLEAAKSFIEKVLIKPSFEEGEYLIDENYKSQLLEYTQASKLNTPSYCVVREEGPQHKRVFTINVKIDETEYGIGKGRNKKTAEQNAAKMALNKLNVTCKDT